MSTDQNKAVVHPDVTSGQNPLIVPHICVDAGDNSPTIDAAIENHRQTAILAFEAYLRMADIIKREYLESYYPPEVEKAFQSFIGTLLQTSGEILTAYVIAEAAPVIARYDQTPPLLPLAALDAEIPGKIPGL